MASTFHAFLYSDGTLNDLGTFGGISGYAGGINNSGQIAACYDTADGGTHAILYDHGAITDLGNLGGNVTVAAVINSSGVIAGTATTIQGYHPFVYEKGTITDLGIPCAYSYATGINDAGQIVGAWGGGNAFERAFLYQNEKLFIRPQFFQRYAAKIPSITMVTLLVVRSMRHSFIATAR